MLHHLDAEASSRLEQINTQEYNRHLHNQEDMMRAGYDVKCLAGAMTYLKRCRKINISTSIHAWGMRRLRQRIGILRRGDLHSSRKQASDNAWISNLLSFEHRDEAGRFSEIAKDLYIPKLESITLHLIDTTKEDITILLLCHHRTLRTVVLESIQLDGDLTAWRWLIEVAWRSLELDEFCILPSWAERKDEDFSFAKLEDIIIVDNDSYNKVIGLI
ncbi:Uncharacterized protein HZ326_19162 [Fusarium oxysporum f. sp. albedinis]|nr:Uncharacterized protein HZ326_19707 [Fusarium oxysporum f. sp. albedinis]KAJ0137889.1 Uncharacterized protein HZ326_19162 [Fusarium oxysporum f. sp. albedinis]